MKNFLNEWYSFCRLLPELIVDEIENIPEIEQGLTDYKRGDQSIFKGQDIMQIVDELPLAREYKEIFLIGGNVKRATYRQQQLRRRIIKELHQRAWSKKFK